MYEIVDFLMLLANFCADLVTVKHMGGWKSSSFAETYIEESIASKILL